MAYFQTPIHRESVRITMGTIILGYKNPRLERFLSNPCRFLSKHSRQNLRTFRGALENKLAEEIMDADREQELTPTRDPGSGERLPRPMKPGSQ